MLNVDSFLGVTINILVSQEDNNFEKWLKKDIIFLFETWQNNLSSIHHSCRWEWSSSLSNQSNQNRATKPMLVGRFVV